MKYRNQILISVGIIAILLISWVIVITSKSAEERQIKLMDQALSLMQDGIYVLAVPLLEEAAEFLTNYSWAVEAELKRAYLALLETHGYPGKYVRLLENQMGRRDAPPEIFVEAASYFLDRQRTTEAFEVFRNGIEKTGCEYLKEFYESNRYIYELHRTGYDFASAIHDDAVRVQKGGLWGIALANGSLMIPYVYESVSTLDSDRAIAKKDGEIFAVNIDNNRVALLAGYYSDFGMGFSEDRFPLFVDGLWRRATGDFLIGGAGFEELGMYRQGHVAAKVDGKWGVIDKEMNWLIPPIYDDIIRDELGRCYGQGVVFARRGTGVYLYRDGKPLGVYFEDAKPFSDEGFAAVKNGGKWGFVDNNGDIVIDFAFDDALSFGQHLAAVRVGDFWGYISVNGKIVIEPVFLDAKSFSNGSAPVKTERGWDFITLIEFRS